MTDADRIQLIALFHCAVACGLAFFEAPAVLVWVFIISGSAALLDSYHRRSLRV